MFDNLGKFEVKTLLLYIFIVIFASFFGFLYQKSLLRKKSRKLYFIISFVIVAFFAMFNSIGYDKDYGYKPLYMLSDKEILSSGMEYGFLIITLFLKHISSSFSFYVAVISFVTILLFYISFYKFRRKINVGLSILIFTCLFYFQQFNLMRIYLASGILLYGFTFLVNKKEFKFLICLLISILIHYAAIFVLIAYIVFKILYRGKKTKLNNLYRNYCILIVLSIVAIIMLPNIISILNRFNILFVGKVEKYYESPVSFKIGFGLIFNIIPYLFIFSLFNRSYLSVRMKAIILSYFLVILIVNFMAYSIPVVGRATICLNAPLLLVVPYLYRVIRCKKYVALNIFGFKLKSNTKTLRLLVFAYFILALTIYLNDYVISDGISSFRYIWN